MIVNDKELLKVINKEKSYTEEDLLLFIYDLRKENARLKDKLNKINNLLNEPTFEYDNIPCNIENEITQLKDILKEN